MKILLADDDPLATGALQSYLDTLGYTVVTAADGDQALHNFAAERPDVVVLDVDMPIADGFEVARCIRAMEGHRWIPIIFLSGQSEPATIAAGIDAGGDDYLIKPVSLKVLLAKIEALRRITHQQEQLSSDAASGQATTIDSTIDSTIEIRWFFPASPAFRRPLLFAGAVPAERTDWYAVPGHPQRGIKLRNNRLELKLQLQDPGRQLFPGAWGKLEQWCKWSLPLQGAPAVTSLQTTGWIAVGKKRFLIYFAVGSDSIYQLDQCPEDGYQLEWCELEVLGQHWLTLALEGSGDTAIQLQNVHRVVEHIMPQLRHYPLDTAHSFAYPDWLNRLRNIAAE